jgi:hypothetical protein
MAIKTLGGEQYITAFEMLGDITMDGKRILELPAPVDPAEPARKTDVDATLPKSGGTMTGALVSYAVVGITAATTQTQGQGALTGDVNQVATVANASDTVTLPSVASGKRCVVLNDGANTLKIYPASGHDLGAGTNASTTLAAGGRLTFLGVSATKWDLQTPAGSTTVTGSLQLTDSIGSTSTTTAATPNAVKTAYDLAAAALPKAGGTLTGALRQTPSTQAFNATLSFDASANNSHSLTGAVTSNFTVTIANASAGDTGVIKLTQDGTGGWKITSITCSGFTAVMTPDTLTTINTTPFKVASANSVLSYQCLGAICYVSMSTGVTIGYS